MPISSASNGNLYILGEDGTYRKFMKVEPIDVSESSVDEPIEAFAFPDEPVIFRGRIKMPKRKRRLLALTLLGYPSNNWLKMHGYPMRRKMRWAKPRRHL